MNENILLIQNETFIVSFTKSIINNIKNYKSVMEDILQQARIAFLMAIRDFNPEKGNSIQEFSKLYIKRSVMRMLSNINKHNKRYKNFTDRENYS